MTKKSVAPEVSFAKIMLRLKLAGLTDKKRIIERVDEEPETLEEISDRVRKLLGILSNTNKKENKMIYFIMYDIEDNKIRSYIAKYLIRKGCTRVQKSVFIANTDRKVYSDMQQTLKSVQEMYENNDSIFFIPVSTDEVRSMKVIGKSVDFDLVTGSKNTLFF